MKTSRHCGLLVSGLLSLAGLLLPTCVLSADDPAVLLEQMQHRKKPQEVDHAIREILDENVPVDNKVFLGTLASILNDRHAAPALRELAAYALGKAGKQASDYIADLERALGERSLDWKVQRAAAAALGRIGIPTEDVRTSLHTAEQTNNSETVRAASLIALARLDRPTDAVDRLAKALDDTKSTEVQRAAAYNLAQMGPIAAGATLALMNSITTHDQPGDKDLVEVDVWALGLIGPEAAEDDPAVIPTLARTLHDHRAAIIRRVAAVALQHIGSVSEEYQNLVVVNLSSQLKAETDLDAKIAMAVALAALGEGPHSGAANALFEALRSTDDRALQQAACTGLSKVAPPPNANVSALVAIATEEYPDVRAAAMEAIGHIHQQPGVAIPVLVKALQDEKIPSVRVAAAEALAEFKSFEPMNKQAIEALIKASGDTRTRFVAVKTLGTWGDSFRLHLENAGENPDFSLEPLLQNSLTMVKHLQTLEPGNSEFADAAKSLDEARTELIQRKWREQIRAWYAYSPFISKGVILSAIYLMWIVFLHTVVLRFFPLSLIRWNEFLESLGTVKVSTFIAMKLRTLLLWSAYKDSRVLTAWVEKHAETARFNFIKNSANGKGDVLPLPVEVDGVRYPELRASTLQGVCGRKKWFLRIVGEGGLGKSTIAHQIGLWAVGNDKEKRLVRDRRMLPVLLERTGAITFLQDWPHFRVAIRGKLQDLIEEPHAIPDWLCDRLLEDSRLLVIIDGLSEMTSVAEQPLPLRPDFSLSSLIVTSRSDALWLGINHTDIRPLRIDSNHLSSFMNLYVGRTTKLDDAELFSACSRLAAMMGPRSITPLLARLYAEQLAQRGPQDQFPENIPDLVLGYVSTLNRNRNAEEPNHLVVHRAAELAAWECCKTNYSSGSASKDKVYDEFSGCEGMKVEFLDYLETRLQLVRSIPPANSYIEFSFDRIADYLAGLWLLHSLKTDEDWLEFLKAVDHRTNQTESVADFLSAVLECCLRKRDDFKCSAWILDLLADRIRTKGRATPGEPPAAKRASA
jgi:hypothetical protein